MFTTTFRDLLLDQMDSKFCSLIVSVTNFRTGSVTEATYTGYGTRPGITFGAQADTTPAGGRQVANSAAVTHPANSSATAQSVMAWGLHSAATAGSIYGIFPLDADSPIVGTAATGDVITTESAHGLASGQAVFVLAAPGVPLATGLAENTTYVVKTTSLTTAAFALSATTALATAVDITAGGAGLFIPYTPVSIAAGATPEFAIGALVIKL
jgi:hypothetical protein